MFVDSCLTLSATAKAFIVLGISVEDMVVWALYKVYSEDQNVGRRQVAAWPPLYTRTGYLARRFLLSIMLTKLKANDGSLPLTST